VLSLIKFDDLEGKIKGIIEDFSFLKKRNEELEELVKNKNGELEEANSKTKGLKEELDAVHARVDSLLDMLQDISVQQ
jgi:Protein of unknown function (DUF904).